MKVLIAFEERIFHDLSINIFQLANPEVQILISIFHTLQQVEAFYATIINSFGHSLMKIRIMSLESNSGLCSISMTFSSSAAVHLWESPSIIVCTWYVLCTK
jgi:hypothetical protein